MARLGKEHLGDMSDEGERARLRRERGGWDKNEVADKAGVHRNTYAAFESGSSFNRSTLTKVERALTELEHEAGIDAPPLVEGADEPKFIEVRLEGLRGVRSAVVKGPVEDPAALVELIKMLTRELRQDENGDA